GGLVNIYTEASTDSPIVKQIVDGTDVEVLEEADSFYLVRHGDEVGYMTKDEVQIGGLTTVQIVAIVLVIFVLIAGTCIFVAIYLTRKKADEESRRKDR
ncbi:MAG: SH3 domain-containing protein, partial [Clostridia bacterium]|nr:SH3 domain-containing protein [Clostridia bacterium]